MKRVREGSCTEATVSKEMRHGDDVTQKDNERDSCNGGLHHKIAALTSRIIAPEERVAKSEERAEEARREASGGSCQQCSAVHPLRKLFNTRGTDCMQLCEACHCDLDPYKQRTCHCDWDDDPRSCTCFMTIDDLC